MDSYLIPRLKKKINRFYIIRGQKLKDLVIFFMLTFGVFLPVRWFFYGYVTHHVLPNMGMVTLIAVIMFILIRSGKLGFIGDSFNRQMIRFAASKTFKRVLIFSLALSLYTGVPLLFMERGEFVHQDNLQMFDANSIRSAYLQQYVINNTLPIGNSTTTYVSISQFCDMRPNECIVDPNYITLERYHDVMLNKKLPTPEIINKVNNMTLMESYNYNIKLSNNYDFLFSTAMYLANVQSNGWSGHFSTVWFVEEIEAVGLFFLYRRWYLKHSIGEPWLGMFNVNLKKIMYTTEKHDKFYHGRNTRPEDKRPITISILMMLVGVGLNIISFKYDIIPLSWLGLGIILISIIYLWIDIKKKTKINKFI